MNIVETLREASVKMLLRPNMGFSSCFSIWANEINDLTPAKTPAQIINLGDNLSNIFALTGTKGRTQSELSGGGAVWEAFVCWYLNLCLIGRRTVVIKHNRSLIPNPVSDAITVNYNNFSSNTESDLIAITFPDKREYDIAREELSITDENGILVPLFIGARFNFKQILDALCHKDFADIEIHVIQCKTNWNDNAQIPMLWDMVYSANNFSRRIDIGRNGYSIHSAKHFTYSFVTVPTSRVEKIKPTSTCVKRVDQISGGNYWGRATVSGVARSVKEMLGRNLSTGHDSSHLVSLETELPKLNSDYRYFNIY